ncbi:unnamed protein product, partial [Tilletia laevis]
RSPPPLGPSSPALDLYLFRSSVLSLGNGAFLLS